MAYAETLKDIFRKEAAEILTGLENDLLVLEEHWDAELVNRIFRYLHTLKGSSGMAGFKEVNEFTHKLENLLDAMRTEKPADPRGVIDLLLEGSDWIKASMADDDAGDEALARRKELLLGRAERLTSPPGGPGGGRETAAPGAGKPGVEGGGNVRSYRIRVRFNEGIFKSGIDPLMIIEDLAALGEVETRRIDHARLPSLADMDPEKCYLAWDLTLRTGRPLSEVEGVFLFVRDDCKLRIEETAGRTGKKSIHSELKPIGEILLEEGALTEGELDDVLNRQAETDRRLGDLAVEKGYATKGDIKRALGEQEQAKRTIESDTVRVETVKLDTLLNLLGEIVIGQSAISRIAGDLDEENSFRLKNALYSVDRVTREFQEQILLIRMIPIGPSFERFRRFVRDQSRSIGKEIRLEIEGGETELDKTVIERISDPLKHMIRNAIDHGLETPQERAASGKPETGTVSLRAYHQQGNVFIEVSDDGRGMDRAKIRAKAESMGLLRPGEEVSDQRLLPFLFLPGFSTADRVGDLSGRGVGMDVVKTNIDSLRGSVEIETRPGKGSTFRIKLPLTLAIIDGMLVRVGENVYILPLLSIVESMQPKREDISTVKEKGEVVLVRDEYLSLVRLYELFGVTPEFRDPWNSLVVIVEAGMSRVGMMIDELMGQQQIVIKSIENYITHSRAVSGAAILGDGKVALIIDVHGLVEELVK